MKLCFNGRSYYTDTYVTHSLRPADNNTAYKQACDESHLAKKRHCVGVACISRLYEVVLCQLTHTHTQHKRFLKYTTQSTKTCF